MEAAIRQWEHSHPKWDVIVSIYPGTGNTQKLMTAIVGGDPPSLVLQNRNTIAGWASRGAFLDLDPYLKDSTIRPDHFYSSAWNESRYQGKTYGIPYNVDVRALFYNKKLLREAGFVNKQGQVVPPRTWAQLREYTHKLTKRDSSGRMTQLGFAPNYGNSWLYLYAWLNGGNFLSEDGKTVTMNSSRVVQALKYMVNVDNMVGGIDQIQAFLGSTTGVALNPFLTGRLAMEIDGEWVMGNAALYAPNLSYGVAPPPAPAGRPTTSWSGGFGFIIPATASHPRATFSLLEYIVSDEGFTISHRVNARYAQARGQGYIPRFVARPKVNQRAYERYVKHDPNLKPQTVQAFKMLLGLLPDSHYRPVTPVGELMWDEQVRAIQKATFGGVPAQVALNHVTSKVQRRLNALTHRQQSNVTSKSHIGVWLIVAVTVAFILLGCLMLGWVMYRQWRNVQVDQVRAAAGFLSPWLIGFILLLAGPFVASLIFSFCQYDVLHPAHWIGLENYRRLFHDNLFWYSLANTFYMLLAVPLTLIVGLAIALLLNTELWGIKLFRTLFYLPAVVPVVASSVLWLWVLNPSSGLINTTLRLLGLNHPPLWLASPSWLLGSKAAIVLMLLWGAGSSMIIWLAGLKGIPRQLYEAARIDGAGSVRQFIHVTMPMLTPYIFFNLIISMIGIMQIFTQAMVMTNGGPADSTLFYMLYLFNRAFKYFEMGYASAMAWILLLIIFIMTGIQLWAARRWVQYDLN